MKRISFIIAALAGLFCAVSCNKNVPEELIPLDKVSMSIIPDYSDGSVNNCSDNGSFFLRVAVTPEKYLGKFSNDGKYIYRADFRKVTTRAESEEGSDFSVTGEVTAAFEDEGYMTVAFTIGSVEAADMLLNDYAVSFSIRDRDGGEGVSTAFVPVSLYDEGGYGGEDVLKVIVNSSTLSVKLSGEEGIDEDLIVQASPKESSAIVRVASISGKPLVIRKEDGTIVVPEENGNRSTFVISDITSDITVTLAYAKIITLSASFIADYMPNEPEYTRNFAKGTGQLVEGRSSGPYEIQVEEVAGYRQDSLVCGDKKALSNTIELETVSADTEVKAYYTLTNILDGAFSVGENKRVRFSKGNLWCDGSGNGWSYSDPAIKSWEFEDGQYSTPKWRIYNHISHLLWCRSAKEATRIHYYERGAENDILFTNKTADSPNDNFVVNGLRGFWRALSGGKNGEWNYLLNGRTTTYGAGTSTESRRYAAVKVDGMSGLLLFPDEFSWPSELKEDEPETFNSKSDNWNNRNYEVAAFEVLQNAGCVFLPAAGYRDGSTSFSDLGFFGSEGYYWASDPINNNNAYGLEFSSDTVNPAREFLRFHSNVIRLVADCK